MSDEPLSARDEIRVSEFGLLRCPSCGELAAELLGRGHCLIQILAEGQPEAECRDGKRVVLDGWEAMRAAANIALADDVWRRETLALRELGFPA